jgi:hypothetical protein
MRSGIDSVRVSKVATKTLYAVPAAQRFVLTDINTVFLSAERGRWFSIVDDGSTYRWVVTSWDHPVHFQTGLVFDAGHAVGVQISYHSGTTKVGVSWSGYVVSK